MSRLRELVTAAKAGIENLTPAEAAGEIDESGVLLVDVREPAETTGGIIPTAARRGQPAAVGLPGRGSSGRRLSALGG